MTEQKKRILWIDNDSRYIYPFEVALQEEGYEVVVVQTVSEGEALIAGGDFGLVILDVMIPVTAAEEAGAYTPEKTDETHKTGLVFYERHRALLLERNIVAIAMTVRIDQGIADEFAAAGLPRECFVRKFEVRDSDTFVAKIRSVFR